MARHFQVKALDFRRCGGIVTGVCFSVEGKTGFRGKVCAVGIATVCLRASGFQCFRFRGLGFRLQGFRPAYFRVS